MTTPAGPPDRPRVSRAAVLGTQRARIPFDQSVRMMLAMGGPMLVAVLFGRPEVGSLLAVGALIAPSVESWTYPQRARRLVSLAVVMAMAFAAGQSVAAMPAGLVIVVGAVAALAVLVAGLLGQWAAPFATIIGVAAILGGGLAVGGGLADWAPAWVAAGGLWVAFVFCLGWVAHRWEPQTAAVGNAFSAVADYLAAVGTPAVDGARVAARRALLVAWDAVEGGTVEPSGHPGRMRLVALLWLAQQQVDAAASLAFGQSAPVPPALVQAVRAVALAVGDPRLATMLCLPAAPQGAGRRLLRCYVLAVQAQQVAGQVDPAVPELVMPIRETLRDRLHGMRPVRTVQFLVAVRIGAAVAAATALAGLLDLRHGYWVAIAVLFVMRSDPAGTRIRAAQRSLGTVAGVAVGGGLLLIGPSAAWVALAMCLVGYLLPWAQQKSFLLGSALRTGYALLLVQAADPAQFPGWLLGERILDSTLGAAIAVLASMLLWPTAATRRLPQAVAASLRSLAELLRATAAAAPGQAQRDAVILQLLGLQGLFDQALGEPRRAWPDTESFWPVVVFTLRLGAPIRQAGGAGDDDAETQPLLSRAGAAQLADVFDGLAAAVVRGDPAPALPWSSPASSASLLAAAQDLHGAVAAAAKT